MSATPSACVPGRLPSLANQRLHWAAKSRLIAGHRQLGALLCIQALRRRPDVRAIERMSVHLVRIGPRALDGDNAIAAFKGIRDGIATWFGVDDGAPWFSWTYDQAKGPYAVRATFTSEAASP